MSSATKTPGGTSTHKRRRQRPDEDVKYSLNDAELLDCPICFESLDSPPIYQCQNGHIACSACCQKLEGKKCPSCSLPTGSIRCISLEKILASLEVSCKYAPHGCACMCQKGSKLENHESSCYYRPFPCPFSECVFRGSWITLPLHLSGEHQVPTVEHNAISRAGFTMKPTDQLVMVKVEEEIRSEWGTDVFVLHRERVRELKFDGDLFFCTSVGQCCDHKRFHLKVGYNDGADHVYSVKSTGSRSLQHVVDHLDGGFLLLPALIGDSDLDSGDELKEPLIEVHLHVAV